MSGIFIENEKKERPGLYRRITNDSSAITSGAIDGVCAATIQADWGPVGMVTEHENISSVEAMYGDSGIAKHMFNAGAKTVYVCRLGSGGTKGTIELKDDASTSVLKLTTKYEGTRSLTVSVKPQLGYTDTKEFLVYDGAKLIERITFTSGAKEPDVLVEAINQKSTIFTAVKVADGSGVLSDVSQEAVTVGTNPTITNESYSEAFNLLEAYTFNTIAVDTADVAVHALLHEYLKRIYDTGKLCIGVIGEPTKVPFDTRLEHAAAFNDCKIVYVGGSGKDGNGALVEGYEAAALVAGLIASTPSSSSIVHKVVPGLVESGEKLTNTQYVNAIKRGMLLFSDTGEGQAWCDSGVNTLVTPDENQDDGWKKIKRVKTRFELMDRIDRTLAPVIGKINCNDDGVANIIKLGMDVINAMYNENKILSGGSFYEDPDRPHEGDSAWFIIDVNDMDTIEKVYLTYVFRFSAN